MQLIEAIIFEPVGCLAEFPVEVFKDIAAQVFSHRTLTSTNGSSAYWELLDILEASAGAKTGRGPIDIEGYESRAARRSRPYDDVVPALSELKSLGLTLIL